LGRAKERIGRPLVAWINSLFVKKMRKLNSVRQSVRGQPAEMEIALILVD
jgi:hypothetical protein